MVFPKPKQRKKKQRDTLETFYALDAIYEGREMVLNTFVSYMFPLPPIEGTGRPSQ